MGRFFQPIDLYCERIGAGLLAEPLNLFSNLSFIIAGYFCLMHCNKRPKSKDLAIAILVVGLGSALFHSVAVFWTMIADIIPIVGFVLMYFYTFMKDIAENDKRRMKLYFSLFGMVTFGLSAISLRFLKLNGSDFYLGAIIMPLVFSFLTQSKESARTYRVAFIILVASLYMRIIDKESCDQFEYGTHFLWHTFNGLALYLLVAAYDKSEIRKN